MTELNCRRIVSVDIVFCISPQKEAKRIEVWGMRSPNMVRPEWNHTVSKLVPEKVSCCSGSMGSGFPAGFHLFLGGGVEGLWGGVA